MWGWLLLLPALALLLYLFFLKRELRRLKGRIKELPARARYGSRLYIDFRERNLMGLVDELNQMIDAFERNHVLARQMEENVQLSIAGLSHDLRTPLTSIRGYLQLLQTTHDETKKAQYIAVIDLSVRRLLELTDRFYDLARIETNQKELSLTMISLSSLVEETFLSFYEQLEERSIALQFPEHAEETNVIADPLLLVRVLQNIVQNILRYGGTQAVIEYERIGNELLFRVSNDLRPDNNINIDKVFQRFYTEVTSRTNTEAGGLGLYLSKKLIEKLDGRMNARLQDRWFILEIHLPVRQSGV
ncbi:sensor histidine kinase [Paenibacillus sp. strain BS8-2]